VAELQEQQNNEAFIDRISVVKVPYCLRVMEERKIYEKLLETSELSRRRAPRGHSRCWRASASYRA